MAVRIRMKKLGRKHRSYFRIVAIDSRQPRDGRVIEELGSYDPMVKDTDSRVRLRPSRITTTVDLPSPSSAWICRSAVSSRAPVSRA